jgi:hypothetical protein
MSNRIFGFHTRLRSGIFAGAILALVNVTAVRAQSGGPTEPPPFDPDKSAARAARAKAKPPAAPAPRSDAAPPKAPTTPSAGTA